MASSDTVDDHVPGQQVAGIGEAAELVARQHGHVDLALEDVAEHDAGIGLEEKTIEEVVVDRLSTPPRGEIERRQAIGGTPLVSNSEVTSAGSSGVTFRSCAAGFSLFGPDGIEWLDHAEADQERARGVDRCSRCVIGRRQQVQAGLRNIPAVRQLDRNHERLGRPTSSRILCVHGIQVEGHVAVHVRDDRTARIAGAILEFDDILGRDFDVSDRVVRLVRAIGRGARE